MQTAEEFLIRLGTVVSWETPNRRTRAHSPGSVCASRGTNSEVCSGRSTAAENPLTVFIRGGVWMVVMPCRSGGHSAGRSPQTVLAAPASNAGAKLDMGLKHANIVESQRGRHRRGRTPHPQAESCPIIRGKRNALHGHIISSLRRAARTENLGDETTSLSLATPRIDRPFQPPGGIIEFVASLEPQRDRALGRRGAGSYSKVCRTTPRFASNWRTRLVGGGCRSSFRAVTGMPGSCR